MLNDEAALQGLADTVRREFAFTRGAKPNTHGTGTPMPFAVGLLPNIAGAHWNKT
jgi:hypothetical protein